MYIRACFLCEFTWHLLFKFPKLFSASSGANVRISSSLICVIFTHMRIAYPQPNFSDKFFSVRPKFFCCADLLSPFLDPMKTFLNVRCFRYFKNYYEKFVNFAYAPTYMRMLRIRIKNLCIRPVHASIAYACTEHTRISNSCVH